MVSPVKNIRFQSNLAGFKKQPTPGKEKGR